ncbi:hypothetical protein [Acinetobacter soli]|uniref:hypothetical protein n=1 Tax=Acinetobacter soli TaxID=487316 RepID=UPI0006E1CDC4|nr:hypothetical protein [Acinetobacter soli]KQD03314.1 hypothetical protein APD01_00165 [Acinetobacter soli]
MKKIVLIGLMLTLTGCKDPKTNLNKNVVNTAYSECYQKLYSSLKSPSSLKLITSSVINTYPSAVDVSKNMLGIIDSNGQVEKSVSVQKTRFRELKIYIDYEADNSFGASIKNRFNCNYLYKLNEEKQSPETLNFYSLETGEDKIEVSQLLSDFSKQSNYNIDNKIKNIINNADFKYGNRDEEIIKESIENYKNNKMNDEAQKLRESWDKSFSQEFQGANLSGA